MATIVHIAKARCVGRMECSPQESIQQSQRKVESYKNEMNNDEYRVKKPLLVDRIEYEYQMLATEMDVLQQQQRQGSVALRMVEWPSANQVCDSIVLFDHTMALYDNGNWGVLSSYSASKSWNSNRQDFSVSVSCRQDASECGGGNGSTTDTSRARGVVGCSGRAA